MFTLMRKIWTSIDLYIILKPISWKCIREPVYPRGRYKEQQSLLEPAVHRWAVHAPGYENLIKSPWV